MQTNRLIALNLAAGAALLCLVLPSAAWRRPGLPSVRSGADLEPADAQRKCPEVAKAERRHWNGQWRTTVPGRDVGLRARCRRRGQIRRPKRSKRGRSGASRMPRRNPRGR